MSSQLATFEQNLRRGQFRACVCFYGISALVILGLTALYPGLGDEKKAEAWLLGWAFLTFLVWKLASYLQKSKLKPFTAQVSPVAPVVSAMALKECVACQSEPEGVVTPSVGSDDTLRYLHIEDKIEYSKVILHYVELSDLKRELIVAPGADEAVEIMRIRSPEEFDAVIMDSVLAPSKLFSDEETHEGRWTSAVIYQQLGKYFKRSVPVIIHSGMTDPELTARLLEIERIECPHLPLYFRPKPMPPSEIVSAVDDLAKAQRNKT